jgi:hypothetical protein
MNAQTISEMNRAAIWSHIDENNLPVKKHASAEAVREALITYYAEITPVEVVETLSDGSAWDAVPVVVETPVENELVAQAKKPKSEPVVCRVYLNGKSVLTLKGKTPEAVIAKFDAWAATKPVQTAHEKEGVYGGKVWEVPRGTAELRAV